MMRRGGAPLERKFSGRDGLKPLRGASSQQGELTRMATFSAAATPAVEVTTAAAAAEAAAAEAALLEHRISLWLSEPRSVYALLTPVDFGTLLRRLLPQAFDP